MKKKTIAALLAATLILSIASCNDPKVRRSEKTSSSKATEETSSEETFSDETETTAESSIETEETTEATSESTAESTTKETTAASDDVKLRDNLPDDIEERLKLLDNVKSVEKVKEAKFTYGEGTDYLITFEQPIDHKDPSKGTFEQKARLVYTGNNAPNFFECNGYTLSETAGFHYKNELASNLDGNYFEVEYRFFGESVPEGLDSSKVDLWEYLTSENAAADFHAILQQLKTILPGNWSFSGGSKGGELTLYQAMHYPYDADMFVAYVVPFPGDPQGKGFFDNIYTTIGDGQYGPEKAQEYRDLVLRFQVECIKYRDELQDKYWDYAMECGNTFTEYTTKEILWDMAVLDFATIMWQYNADFSLISDVFELKDGDQAIYLESVLDLVIAMNEPSVWCTNNPLFPYYIQAYRETGEHDYTFKYIREALEKDGTDKKLVITEDMEDMLLYHMMLTPEQQEAFSFDPSVFNDVKENLKTTDRPIYIFDGASDVWDYYGVHECDNENVHLYVNPNGTHNTWIIRFSDSAKIFSEMHEIMGG